MRQASLAELASAAGASISDVRLALRRLAEQLEVAGMQVLDDGSHVQLAPARRFEEPVTQLVQPERLPRLTQEMAEVLATVIMDGMASRRRIEEVRGGYDALDWAGRAGLVAPGQLGNVGPASLPKPALC